MIDLHTHSTFSDGSLSPEDLVERACGGGLSAIALTDHDTTAGLLRFLAACGARGIRGVPGVEISVDVSKGTLHMLGYFVEAGHTVLESALACIRGGRDERNQEMLEKLNALGLPLSWDDVRAFVGEDVVGRPHFAQALVQKGYVASKTEAFDAFLGKGKPAYAERYRLSAEESIRVIRAAGGLPVLSHPFTLGLGSAELRRAVAALKDAGLEGIEVYYSEHNPRQVAQYRALADALDLVPTGGSDFHGDLNPAIELGRGFGGLKVSDDVLERLDHRLGTMAERPGKSSAAAEV